MKYFTITCCLIFTLIISSFSWAADWESDPQRGPCTINEINGPVISTSCREFYFAEQVTITDIRGRELFPWQIPVPCDAILEYTCNSKNRCSVQTLIVQKVIKRQPE